MTAIIHFTSVTLRREASLLTFNHRPKFNFIPFLGYGQKSQLKQSRQTIYAGVTFEEDGYPRPTAAGRYCEYQHITIDRSSDIETFEEYKKTLKLACDPGSP